MKYSRRGGFTLIELLVVIGVVVLLMALLLPMLNRMRESARSVGCASNEREIYQAAMAYAADHDRVLPATPYYWDSFGSAPRNVAWNMQSLGVADFKHGALWAYMGGDEARRGQVLWCPSDIAEPPRQNGGVDILVRNFSYSFNAQVNWTGSYFDFPHACPPLRMGQIVEPSSRILIFEEVGPNDGSCFAGTGSIDDYPSSRHMRAGGVSNNPDPAGDQRGGVGNHCFADGHVESLSPQLVFANPNLCDLLH